MFSESALPLSSAFLHQALLQLIHSNKVHETSCKKRSFDRVTF